MKNKKKREQRVVVQMKERKEKYRTEARMNRKIQYVQRKERAEIYMQYRGKREQ